MKKILSILLAASAVVAISCTKSTFAPSEEETAPFLVTVDRPALASEAGVSSKAVFADGKGISWQSSDASRFSMLTSGGKLSASTGVTLSDDGKATFSFSEAPSEGETLAFFYGVDSNLSHSFSSSQTQAAPGSIAPENLCFTSSSSVLSEGKCTPKMTLSGSLLRFLIYSSTGAYSSEKVEAVSLSASEAVAAAAKYGLSGVESITREESSSVKVSLSSPAEVSATDSDATLGKGIYLSLAPSTSLSSAYSYIITTDKAVYTLAASEGTSFADGKLKNILVDLENTNVARKARELELYIPGAEDIGNYIKLGAPGAFDSYGTISVSFWFKGAEKLNYQRQGSIISNFISAGGCFYGWEVNTWASDDNGNGAYRLRVSRAFGSDGKSLREPSNSYDGYTSWHHIAYTFDNSTHYTALYLDGVKIGDDTFDSEPKAPGYQVQMCAFKSLTDSGNPKSVSGSMKKLRFWSRALSAEEVSSDMTSEVTGSETGLIAAWDFTSRPSDSSNVLDKTGNHSAQILGDKVEWRQVE